MHTIHGLLAVSLYDEVVMDMVLHSPLVRGGHMASDSMHTHHIPHTHTTHNTHIPHTHTTHTTPHTPHLYMALWLHKSSHHSKTSKQVTRSSVCSHSWYDCVVGSFSRGQDIWVEWIKGEIGSSILHTRRSWKGRDT